MFKALGFKKFRAFDVHAKSWGKEYDYNVEKAKYELLVRDPKDLKKLRIKSSNVYFMHGGTVRFKFMLDSRF